MSTESMINLDKFYPEELEIISIENISDNSFLIKMKSHSTKCNCIKCGEESTQLHGTYKRIVQDLPILGKQVKLEITAHEYKCTNELCDAKTVAETFDGFLNYYSRMTERLADFICSLALETSCEGCSRICKQMSIQISGDTVIKLLLKRYNNQISEPCGAVIGVDDFAFKKRHTYGTVIVDGETHKPIALLDGRDGKELKEWLKQNKQVKCVTRDRASAYAAAISEVLPDAMQIADRFHLHQNLLEAIKHTLNSIVPADIKIPKHIDEIEPTQSLEDECKKNA